MGKTYKDQRKWDRKESEKQAVKGIKKHRRMKPYEIVDLPSDDVDPFELLDAELTEFDER